MFVSTSVEGRLLAVHVLNVADDHDADHGVVSSETEYFMRTLAARRAIPVLQFVFAANVSVAARPKPVANGWRSSSRTIHCGRSRTTKGIGIDFRSRSKVGSQRKDIGATGRRRPRDTLRCPGLPAPATVPKPRSPGVIVCIIVVEHLSSKCNRCTAGATHEEEDGRRCHFANPGWLSCCWDCLGRKLRRRCTEAG
jgi:hypothetical protein